MDVNYLSKLLEIRDKIIFRNIALIAVMFLASLFTEFFLDWALPIIANNVGGIWYVSGLFSSSYLLAAIIGFIGGALADVHGRRSLLVCSSAIMLAGVLMLFLVFGVPSPFIVGLVVALGVAVFFMGRSLGGAAASALMMESILSEDVKGRVLGMIRFIATLGAILGPAILGYIMDLGGVEIALMICVCILVIRLACTYFLKETLILNQEDANCRNNSRSVGRRVREALETAVNGVKTIFVNMPSLAVLEVLGGFVTGAFSTFFPLFLKISLGFSAIIIGLTYSVMAIASATGEIVGGLLVDSLGTRKAVLTVLPPVALAISMISLTGNVLPALTVVPIVITTSLLTSTYDNAVTVEISRRASSEILGSVYGGIGLLTRLGVMMGPLIAGILWSINPGLVFIGMGFAVALMSIIATTWW